MVNHPHRSRVTYEWWLERVTDDEYEDNCETDYFESLADALAAMRRNGAAPDGEKWIIELVRVVGDDGAGITDRQYAILADGALPDQFDGGAAIPKKFREECGAAHTPNQ